MARVEVSALLLDDSGLQAAAFNAGFVAVGRRWKFLACLLDAAPFDVALADSDVDWNGEYFGDAIGSSIHPARAAVDVFRNWRNRC